MKPISLYGLALALLSLTACGKIELQPLDGSPLAPDRVFELFGPQIKSRDIQVVDTEGNPIAGAQVLIGEQLSQPAADNFVSTDSLGRFTAPPSWQGPEPVTISAPGYVRATFLKQTPQGQNLTLRRAYSATGFQLKGRTDGHQVVNNDGKVDFGLVIPAFGRKDILHFDIKDLISADQDTIQVVGRNIKVPSNLTLPRQEENYFVTIRFNKPNYRMHFRSEGVKTVFAGRAQFPLEEVINASQSGKELFELANVFTLLGGEVREIPLQGPVTQENFYVRHLQFNGRQTVQGPRMRSDELVMAAALTPYKDLYFPTDVKNLTTGRSQALTTDGAHGAALLSILRKKSESHPDRMVDRFSSAFQPLHRGAVPELLPLMDDPVARSAHHVQISMITPPSGLVAGASHLVLSKIDKIKSGGKVNEILTILWDVYSPGWESHVQLPQWPNDKMPTGGLRWQVTLTAIPRNNSVKNVQLGPQWLETATHATRSSVDF